MNSKQFSRRSAQILGTGSVAFAAWALLSPRTFASFMGSDPERARLTGTRDLLIGVALLAMPDPMAFSARALADTWDASTVKRPNVARGAAMFACWAAAAALAQAQTSGHHSRRRSSKLPM